MIHEEVHHTSQKLHYFSNYIDRYARNMSSEWILRVCDNGGRNTKLDKVMFIDMGL